MAIAERSTAKSDRRHKQQVSGCGRILESSSSRTAHRHDRCPALARRGMVAARCKVAKQGHARSRVVTGLAGQFSTKSVCRQFVVRGAGGMAQQVMRDLVASEQGELIVIQTGCCCSRKGDHAPIASCVDVNPGTHPKGRQTGPDGSVEVVSFANRQAAARHPFSYFETRGRQTRRRGQSCGERDQGSADHTVGMLGASVDMANLCDLPQPLQIRRNP
jgi:hypothetical protein